MQYKPFPAYVDFHRSRDTLRRLRGPRGSGKTTAAINEIGFLLPKFMFDSYRIAKTRWVVITLHSRNLASGFMHFFTDAQYIQSAGRMLIKHGEIEVEILFPSPRAYEHKYYKMPIGPDGKRHIEWHLDVSFPSLMSLEMTGYFIESCGEEHRDILRKTLNMRIGRYPPRVPVRFGIEEEQ